MAAESASSLLRLGAESLSGILGGLLAAVMVKLSLIALGAVAIAAAGLLALTCRPVRESPQGSGR